MSGYGEGVPVDLSSVPFRELQLPDDQEFFRQMCYLASYPPAVYRQTGQAPPDPDEAIPAHRVDVFLEDWGREGDFGLILEAGTRQVGAAWYRCDEEMGMPSYALGIAIEEASQGQGFGKLLLSCLLARAAENGIPDIRLWVDTQNPTAQSLYKGLGFLTIKQDDQYLHMAASTHPFRAATATSVG